MKKLFFALSVIMSAMLFNSYASETPDIVRVGINASSLAESVTLSSAGGIYTEALFAMPEEATEETSFYIAHSVTVTVGEDGTLICNDIATGETEVDFFKTSEFLTCQEKEYRGGIRLTVKSGKILIINLVSMDEYLYGVVGREMSEYFPLEALKAQSVAARNYAVNSVGRHESEGFDVCNGVHCQAYGAVAREGERVRQAVDETSGMLLYYDGKIVECYYYSSNGGYTENSENVWVAKLGYLKGKADPFEDGSRIPGYFWEVSFTAEEIKESLASRGVDIGDIEDIEVTEYSSNQHAIEIKITGTEGEKFYYKDNIRAAFPERLKSTLFTVSGGDSEASVKVLSVNGLETRGIEPAFVISKDGLHEISSPGGNGRFTFTGRGDGHGVGMSQYGAMFMAEEGYTYEEILKFYFTDTEIAE